MMIDFKYHKRHTDLVAFICTHFGYKIDEKESARSINGVRANHVLKLKNSAGRTTNKIIVYRNTNTDEYYYINPNDDSDKGDIISFINKHSHADESINHLLSQPLSYPKTTTSTSKKKRVFDKQKAFTKPEYTYLKGRGLNINTLDSPLFNGRIFNSPEGYTAFPLYTLKGIVGSLEKYYKDKLDMGGKTRYGSNAAEGIWLSKFDKSKPIDILFIGEAPIDCLSHYQMHQPVGNICYVATGGSFGGAKLRTIQALIDRNDVQMITSIFDNDHPGERFTITAAGILSTFMNNPLPFRMACGYRDGQTFLDFAPKKDMEDVFEYSTSQYPIRLQHRLIEDIKWEGVHSRLRVYFSPVTYNWDQLLHFINEISGGSFQRHRSLSNDFNSDLTGS